MPTGTLIEEEEERGVTVYARNVRNEVRRLAGATGGYRPYIDRMVGLHLDLIERERAGDRDARALLQRHDLII